MPPTSPDPSGPPAHPPAPADGVPRPLQDDPPGKTVGRRTVIDALRVDRSPALHVRRRRGEPFAWNIRSGVYRFKTHEEADQWLLDHQIRRPTP
jgi:hypothetical protein